METRDKYIEVPGRLHSVATEGHVAGADEIYDDAKEKLQSEVNADVDNTIGSDSKPSSVKGRIKSLENEVGIPGSSGNTLNSRVSTLETTVGSDGSVDFRIAAAKSELKGDATSTCDTLGKAENLILEESERAKSAESYRYTKLETYSKEETNSIISRTPETDVIVLDVPSESTALEVLNEVPLEDRRNKLFRVKNDSNTHYDEYGWTGSMWSLLASKDYGIDEEPAENSNNTVRSGGVAGLICNTESNFSKLCLVDRFNNIIAFLSKEDVLNIFVDMKIKALEVDNIKDSENNTFVKQKVGSSELQEICLTTENDDVILGVDKFGKKFGSLTEKSVYDLNPDKDALMHTAANHPLSYRTQIISSTDTHEDTEAFVRFVKSLGDFESATHGLFIGDILDYSATYFTPKMEYFSNLIRNAGKPVFFVCGNHDGGTASRAITACASNNQLYNWFIKPAVDNGWLKGKYNAYSNPTGDYVENKLYYSHEFKDKTLLICLYPFDDGNVIADKTETVTLGNGTEIEDKTYWKPITYSDSYSDISTGFYTVGDKVNIPNYNEYSFECIEDVTIPDIMWNRYTDADAEKYPHYKARRRQRWYGQEQLEWFCNKLCYAAQNKLTLIVTQHLPFSTECEEIVTSPFSKGSRYNYSNSNYGTRYDSSNTDIICQIINALNNRTMIQKSLYPISTLQDTIIDNTTSISGFDFSYDFSSLSEDEKVNGLLMLNGHVHQGGFAKHPEYGFIQLTQDSGKISTSNGIGKSANEKNMCFDHLNVYTVIPSPAIASSEIISGYFNGDGMIEESEEFSVCKFSVEPNTNYIFSDILPEGHEIPFLAWFNSDSELISVEPFKSSEEEEVRYLDMRITAPNHAAYLYMNIYDVYGNGSLYKNVSIHVTRLGNHYLDRYFNNEFMERNNKILDIINF